MARVSTFSGGGGGGWGWSWSLGGAQQKYRVTIVAQLPNNHAKTNMGSNNSTQNGPSNRNGSGGSTGAGTRPMQQRPCRPTANTI
uniref:Uncharacterized protein n=1 Tax=Oryza glumipatula TaxID=40148 RepID=A0A0E0AMX4_9ORYZ